MLDNELHLIENDDLREDIRTILKELPSYFWQIPASSTQKYHPRYACTEHGLIKHTKVALKIAEDLLNLTMFEFSVFEKDLIYASLIIHDGLKYGFDYDLNSYFKHPIYISEFILELNANKKLKSDMLVLVRLAHIVSCHMGQWNKNKYTGEELPIPSDEIDKFVHLCDYLSSRKYLNVEFNENCEIM